MWWCYGMKKQPLMAIEWGYKGISSWIRLTRLGDGHQSIIYIILGDGSYTHLCTWGFPRHGIGWMTIPHMPWPGYTWVYGSKSKTQVSHCESHNFIMPSLFCMYRSVLFLSAYLWAISKWWGGYSVGLKDLGICRWVKTDSDLDNVYIYIYR